jgi:hypothetical protein
VIGAVLYEFIGREVPAAVPATSSVRDVAADAA